ncbi:Hypothetical predicted protein [Lecanosticta acicola]|uniref:DUF7730 domain-containing protein n=1 Tax=Lecanosticta acicola TaxID=111012 RepID=A0AAI8Z745_9PEZI|nr:Hypothetical predicted protein [Lecanosticta acicola]
MARKRKAKALASKKTTDQTTNNATESTDPPRIGFMDLPAEIRTEIYGFVFQEARHVSLEVRMHIHGRPREVCRPKASKQPGKLYSRKTKSWEPAPLQYISILFASRQVFHEAEPVLYGCNVLSFSRTTALQEFIDVIGKRAQHIRHVHIKSNGYKKTNARAAFKALAVAKGLRTLSIEHNNVCPISYGYRPARTSAADVAADCKVLMKTLQKHRQENDLSGSVPEVLEFRIDHPPTSCCVNISAANANIQAQARRIISGYLGLGN